MTDSNAIEQAETNPFCCIKVVTKGGEVYEHAFRIDNEFDFDKWWDARWMHEPMLKVSERKYIAIDMIASISHKEVWA